MKETEHTVDVNASPSEVIDLLLDEDVYPGRLADQIEKVSRVEFVESETLDDGRIRHVLRFTAPTQLPRPLRKFRDKAPEVIHWDEITIIDRDSGKATVEIVPDVPDHWHQKYDNRGELFVEQISEGHSRVHQSLDFSLDAPTGFGLFLNRAVKGEVQNVLQAKADLLRHYFE